MKKATFGALAMVFLGAVTFSVTNTLFADYSGKKKDQVNATAKMETHPSTNNTNQTEITGNEPVPTENFNEVQTNRSSIRMDVNNSSKSNQLNVAASKITAPSSVNSVNPQTQSGMPKSSPPQNDALTVKTNIKPLGSQVAATTNSNTAPTVTSTNSAPNPVGTPIKTNHGQQISQAAIKKAASQQNKKNIK